MGALLREGWEQGGTPLAAGWFAAGAIPGVQTSLAAGGKTLLPSTNHLGTGGRYFMRGGFGAGIQINLVRDAREVYVRSRFQPWDQGFDSSSIGGVLDSVGAIQYHIRHANFTSLVQLVRGVGTVVSTSRVGMYQTFQIPWQDMLMQLYIDPVAGFCRVFKDYDYTNPYGTNGADLNTQGSGIDNFASRFFLFAGRVAFDEIAVNDITLSFTVGTGAQPVVGTTITGAPSGSTGVVTAVLNPAGASPALTGTLQLSNVTTDGVTAWNGDTTKGTQPFAGDVTIAGGVLVVATIAGALDANSGFPVDSFMLGLVPNGDVAGSIQLTPSVGTINSNNVDDIPADNAAALTDYNETAVSGDRDLYEMENVAARGFVAADFASILTVTLNATVESTDGAAPTNLRFVGEDVDGGSGELDLGSDQLMTVATPDGHYLILETAPGGADWNAGGTVITKLDAVRFGAKMNA